MGKLLQKLFFSAKMLKLLAGLRYRTVVTTTHSSRRTSHRIRQHRVVSQKIFHSIRGTQRFPSKNELPYSKTVDVLLEVFGGGSVEIEG